jgi:WASH complex subunit 7
MMAINDIEIPLYYIKYKENNGIDLIKLLRKTTFETFENSFLKRLSKEIEDDLRIQVHSSFIEGLESAPYSDINLNSFLKIKNFKLFDKVIDIRRYIEEDLNMSFYKLTTLNLNNWQTYQQMRVLAKHKYGLNLHEVYLPNQNLEQGKDILEIIRNLPKFTKNYIHNMHSQIFIEIPKESSYINIIGVQQIINSLYTHGKGIINSIINKAFGYISKTVRVLLEILFDDYILSLIKDEKAFWETNKATIKYNYPLKRAADLRQKILNLDENKKNNFITKSIQCITQIGNAVALVRCVRTALMVYNSENENLLTSYKINDFTLQVESKPKNANSHITSSMIGNILNSFYDSNKRFGKEINSLKQSGENELNYLEVLVKSFCGSFSPEKIPDIDLFAFLLPPLILTFNDTAIKSRDNLQKNESGENSYFSNDGFMIGVCFLLKIFDVDKQFESLNWFQSVIAEYENQLNKLKSNEISQTSNTMDIKQINCCLEQFKLQYFTYTSASFLFTELDTIYKSGHLKLNELENKNKSRDLKLNELEKNNKSKHLKLNKLDKYLNY